MKLAIMQPYFFPYIGYFQMINAVDKFILYDDVNYIKGGWINRNNILQNNERKLITLNLVGSSSNKLINEISIGNNRKLFKTISQAYSKSPFFEVVIPIVNEILSLCAPNVSISEIAGESIIKVSDYLNIKTKFEYSSKLYADTKGIDKADRLIEICNRNKANTYINAAGGKELYSKDFFKKNYIDLLFIQNHIQEYQQFNNDFVPFLSIIDVMMFNSVEEIKKMLNTYVLE